MLMSSGSSAPLSLEKLSGRKTLWVKMEASSVMRSTSDTVISCLPVNFLVALVSISNRPSSASSTRRAGSHRHLDGGFLCDEIHLRHRDLLSSGEFSRGACLDQQQAFIRIFYQESRFPSPSAFRMQTEHKGSSVFQWRIVEDCFIFPRPQLLGSGAAIPD